MGQAGAAEAALEEGATAVPALFAFALLAVSPPASNQDDTANERERERERPRPAREPQKRRTAQKTHVISCHHMSHLLSVWPGLVAVELMGSEPQKWGTRTGPGDPQKRREARASNFRELCCELRSLVEFPASCVRSSWVRASTKRAQAKAVPKATDPRPGQLLAPVFVAAAPLNGL